MSRFSHLSGDPVAQSGTSAVAAATPNATVTAAGKKGAEPASRANKCLSWISQIGFRKEKEMFLRMMALLLSAGLSVIDTLTTIHDDARKKKLKNIVNSLLTEVSNGKPLWRTLKDHNFLSAYEIALIRVGEESGSLAKNMEYLALQQEKTHMLRQKVKMAMFYPTIVLVLTTFVTVGLAWFVLPQMVGILTSLNVELPLSTRIIIRVSEIMSHHGHWVAGGIVAFFVGFGLLYKFSPLRGFLQAVFFRLPGFGPMARSATVAEVGIVMGSLLQVGIPPVDAIQYVSEVVDVVAYQKYFKKLAKNIDVGQSFATAFNNLKETRKILPIPAQQLIITGEKAGKISIMFLKMADVYQRMAEEEAQKLPIIIEPILLLFIASLVGIIAFSVLIPIYSIVGSFST